MALPVAKDAAIVYMFGQLEGATKFEGQEIWCRWSITTGECWRHDRGEVDGTTQTALPDRDSGFSIWAHPIMVSFKTATMIGWPKIEVQVWAVDRWGRQQFCAHGMCYLPTQLGESKISFDCWRPKPERSEFHLSYFLGANPMVKSTDLVTGTESMHRQRLRTISAGKIHLRLNVVIQHPERLNYERVQVAAESLAPDYGGLDTSMSELGASRTGRIRKTLASLRESMRGSRATTAPASPR
eukprot:TRINITY_DN16023_c0_g1_i1.p1 TRINITY_DN16023_c0_g1~~TRINITY_DN16023_c0_g1_i1.p1  ORF type:complete len:241 (-),score=5.81 TRINITY_DN16023_c0_g1_i1:54-776(-)